MINADYRIKYIFAYKPFRSKPTIKWGAIIQLNEFNGALSSWGDQSAPLASTISSSVLNV
jgi:hypothetical protein